MFDVENGKIKITKGDTANLEVTLKAPDGTAYDMQEGDELTLTARNELEAGVLFQITSETNVLSFQESDTKGCAPGTYFFDIQLRTAAGEVSTIVGPKNGREKHLTIYPEVTI